MKTQFTGDLLAWTGRAMRSKISPATYVKENKHYIRKPQIKSYNSYIIVTKTGIYKRGVKKIVKNRWSFRGFVAAQTGMVAKTRGNS